jgi:two-component system OmpR family response regulator
VQVGRLRRKLEDAPQNPSLIKTVRGSGYIFTPTVEMT